MTDLGRLRPPFAVDHCANVGCLHDSGLQALNEQGAYLYRDLDSDKLVVFCGDCARNVELNYGDRFKLVVL